MPRWLIAALVAGLLGSASALAQQAAPVIVLNGNAVVSASNPLPITGTVTSGSTTLAPVAPAAPTATNANLIACQFVTAGVTFTNLQQGSISCAANGELMVGGAIASGATDTGNPQKIGGVFNTVAPTVTNGQRIDAQADANGAIAVAPKTATGAVGDATGNTVRTLSDRAGNVMSVGQYPLIFNGTTWDRYRAINGAITAGGGTAAVAFAPTSASTGAITPVVSAAAEGSHVLKASAGNLYSLVVTSGAAAGYVMVFNATSAPADGAVTPAECVVVAANSTVSINFQGVPEAYATGITAVFSTTGCFTKTISATAFFSGKVV